MCHNYCHNTTEEIKNIYLYGYTIVLFSLTVAVGWNLSYISSGVIVIFVWYIYGYMCCIERKSELL